jgi:uncharacterized protein
MTIVASIKEYVLSECRSSKNVFGPAFFEEHLLVVLEYGRRLAAVLDADAEIVELAAYLHDLAAIGDIALIPKHHLLGADLARQVLQRHNYPPARIERVAQCVASHSAPVQVGGGSPEEVCISNADAMSQIARPVYWLYYVFRVRQFDFETARTWYRQRVDSNWSQLIQPAKDMIEKEYRLAKDLLQESQ